MEPATRLRLTIAPAPSDPAGLRTFVEAVSTPGTPQFHQHLTSCEVEDRFGPSMSTIAAVESWMTGDRLTVGRVTGDGLDIPVLGTHGLDSFDPEESWFCWMSFPDPRHPWDPPASESHRVPWRELDLPPGLPPAESELVRILADKPEHWLAYWEGRWANLEGAPMVVVPSKLTADQIREVNAKCHIMNELIDEACGRVLPKVRDRGWWSNTDIISTTDQGKMQGDFGMLYKGWRSPSTSMTSCGSR